MWDRYLSSRGQAPVTETRPSTSYKAKHQLQSQSTSYEIRHGSGDQIGRVTDNVRNSLQNVDDDRSLNLGFQAGVRIYVTISPTG